MPNIHRLLNVTGHVSLVAMPAVTVAGTVSVLPGFDGPGHGARPSPTAGGETRTA